MKILIYTHEFPPFLGGLSTTSYKIAKGATKAGLDVTVLAPSYSGQEKKLDPVFSFRVVRMSGLSRNHGIPSPIKEAVGLVSLKKEVVRINPHVVLLLTREAQTAGGMLHGFPFKEVVRVAGYEAFRYLRGKKYFNKLLGIPIRRLYMRSSKIISPSYATKELLENAGIPGEKIQVIYNGVNEDMISQNPNQEAIKKLKSKFNINSNEKVILTISRLVPGKGQDHVLRALPKVLKEYGDLKYLIVGEGRSEKELKNLADRQGIRSRVIFAGAVPNSEVIDYYDLSYLFIMPNRILRDHEHIEGLPNVIFEAASRGRPVIAGIPGGAKEIVVQGVTGYIVDGNDIDEISSYALDLLKDKRKANDFGRKAKQRIAEQFSEEKMIKGYLDILCNYN